MPLPSTRWHVITESAFLWEQDALDFVRERLPEGARVLAGLLELLPWLTQWHNHLDPQYGQRIGEYYDGFVDEEARALGLTRDAIRAWMPPARATRGRRPRR